MTAYLLLPTAFLLVILPSLKGEDKQTFEFIKTNSGKVYTQCVVFKTDPDGVIIRHKHGGAKILFSDLAPDARAMLGYDAKVEAAYEKERSEAKRQEREQWWEYRKELAKAQAAASAVEASRLQVLATQVAPPYSLGAGYLLGYGWWDGYGLGHPYAFGYGVGRGKGYLGHACYMDGVKPWLFTRGRTTFPAPQGTGNNFNVRGRTFCAPPVPAPRTVTATPAMGPLTPALGASVR